MNTIPGISLQDADSPTSAKIPHAIQTAAIRRTMKGLGGCRPTWGSGVSSSAPTRRRGPAGAVPFGVTRPVAGRAEPPRLRDDAEPFDPFEPDFFFWFGATA